MAGNHPKGHHQESAGQRARSYSWTEAPPREQRRRPEGQEHFLNRSTTKRTEAPAKGPGAIPEQKHHQESRGAGQRARSYSWTETPPRKQRQRPEGQELFLNRSTTKRTEAPARGPGAIPERTKRKEEAARRPEVITEHWMITNWTAVAAWTLHLPYMYKYFYLNVSSVAELICIVQDKIMTVTRMKGAYSRWC